MRTDFNGRAIPGSPPVRTEPNLTGAEREALPVLLNLSDGHSRPLKESSLRPLLAEALEDSIEEAQDELERTFLARFMQSANQSLTLSPANYQFAYSATSTIDIVAKYCLHKELTVGLIEPCFDNIPRSIAYLNVPLMSVPEGQVESIVAAVKRPPFDVLWIVLPNNPTSWQLDESEFRDLVQNCVRHKILMVVDFCFRHFSNVLHAYDQYELLKSSGVDFITIEDTGKTWASQEIKVGLSVSSDSVAEAVQTLHENLLLRVSPFFLAILNRLMADSSALDATKKLVRDNRAILSSLLDSLPVQLGSSGNADWSLPLEWLHLLPECGLTGRQLQCNLAHRGVEVLSGDLFYWASREKDSAHIRVALNRETRIVRTGSRILAQTVADGARK